MIFRSRAPGHVHIVRPEIADHMMGVKRIVHRELIADFGQDFGAEQINTEVAAFGGEHFSSAEIRGGVFDTIGAAKANGWSAEEQALVEEQLLAACEDPSDRGAVWLHVTAVPTAPWPAYDDMHHNTIPEFAETAGLLQEALIYEQRTKRREALVGKLEAKLKQQEQEQTLVAQA